MFSYLQVFDSFFFVLVAWCCSHCYLQCHFLDFWISRWQSVPESAGICTVYYLQQSSDVFSKFTYLYTWYCRPRIFCLQTICRGVEPAFLLCAILCDLHVTFWNKNLHFACATCLRMKFVLVVISYFAIVAAYWRFEFRFEYIVLATFSPMK
jgi:hypothetical protein